MKLKWISRLVMVGILSILFYLQGLSQVILVKDNILEAPKAVQYQWFYNGKKMSGETARNLKPEKSGEYMAIMQDARGIQTVLKVAVKVEDDTVHKVIVIGDSTASFYSASDFPRTGWGQVLQPFFNSNNITVYDKALSGRSSKSFFNDADGWASVLRLLEEGDYLLIQFGHNDQKSDEERHTDPYTTYQDYLSIYIDTALARGAHPILLTSIHRNGWSGTDIKDSHGDYPPAVRDLAQKRDVPLIDLHQKTAARWKELGEDYVTNHIYNNLPANLYPAYLDGNSDNTHLQIEGAWEVCKLVMESINEQKDDAVLGMLQQVSQQAGIVKILPDPALSGTFSGAGVIAAGDTAIISANPKSGYAIANWKLDGDLYSEDQLLELVVNSELMEITGVFDNGYKISLSRDPLKGGIVRGAGSYVSGREVQIQAISKDGYNFVGWYQNDDLVSGDSSYTIEVAAQDEEYVAVFEESTSIHTESINLNFDIYPNPSRETINIISEIAISQLDIIDLLGNVLYTSYPQSTNLSINVSQFAEGCYLLKTRVSKYFIVKRIEVY